VVEEGGEIKGIQVFDGARCNDSLAGGMYEYYIIYLS
jgi:hypothetical protein